MSHQNYQRTGLKNTSYPRVPISSQIKNIWNTFKFIPGLLAHKHLTAEWRQKFKTQEMTEINNHKSSLLKHFEEIEFMVYK